MSAFASSPARAAEITFGTDEIEVVKPAPASHPEPAPRRTKEQTGRTAYAGWNFDSAAVASWLGDYIRNTRFTYGLRVATYDVDGATGRSFRPEGGVYENDLSAQNRYGFADGRFFEWKADLRQLDDRQVTTRRDVQLVGLNAGYGRAGRYEARFGDVFANLSRYSFTRSFEGLSAFWAIPRGRMPDFRLLLASGRVQRGIDNRQFTRYANGLRGAWSGIALPGSLVKPITIGLNASAVHDDRASANVPNLAVLDGRVYSVDWTIPLALADFVLDGEAAKTYVNPNFLSPTSRERVGTAVRGSLRGTPRGWNVAANIERVDPDAQSPLGSVAPDQFRWDASLSGRPVADVQLGLQFLRSENNVTRRLASTSMTHTFGSNLSSPILKRFLDARWDSSPAGALRNAVFTAGYRVSDRLTSNRTFDNSFEDGNFGVSTQWSGWRASANRSYQITIDRLARSNDRRVENWNGQLAREWAIPAIALLVTPSLTYASSRDWADLSRVTNRTRSGSANCGWRWRDKFSGAVSYAVTARDQQLGAADQVQRTITASAAWSVQAPLPTQLGLQFRHNRVDDERPGQDFTEKEAQFTMNTTF